MEYKNIDEYIKDHIENGYLKEDLSPLKCFNCNGKNFSDNIKDTIEGFGACEIEVVCNDCEKQVGYWSYGHWLI